MGQSLSVSFTPTDSVDYTGAADSVLITVSKARPAVTWTNPANITYGTPLSGTQLDATANVPGTFTYTPAAGTVLDAGSHQGLSVSFTPTDSTDYTTVNDGAEHYRRQGHACRYLGRPGGYHLRDGPVGDPARRDGVGTGSVHLHAGGGCGARRGGGPVVWR